MCSSDLRDRPAAFVKSDDSSDPRSAASADHAAFLTLILRQRYPSRVAARDSSGIIPGGRDIRLILVLLKYASRQVVSRDSAYTTASRDIAPCVGTAPGNRTGSIIPTRTFYIPISVFFCCPCTARSVIGSVHIQPRDSSDVVKPRVAEVIG